MSFTTPCFIRKNTPELREALRNMGYVFVGLSDTDGDGDAINCCTGNRGSSASLYFLDDNLNYLNENFPSAIDCGTNEPLFLAIAALRDDTDYMQWFTDGSDFILCDREDWIDMYSVLCSGKGSSYQNELDKYHKATVEELIEHFKTKEQ